MGYAKTEGFSFNGVRQDRRRRRKTNEAYRSLCDKIRVGFAKTEGRYASVVTTLAEIDHVEAHLERYNRSIRRIFWSHRVAADETVTFDITKG